MRQNPDNSDENAVQIDSFISTYLPRHAPHRKTVSPSVALANLVRMESRIRERVINILENLPVGKTFNWVDEVSVELTARMLAIAGHSDAAHRNPGLYAQWQADKKG